MRYLFGDLGLSELTENPTVIYADNKTANQWVDEEKVSAGNMWILQSYHYVREMGPNGENLIRVVHVPTNFNLADIFTKGVPKQIHVFLVPYLCGRKPLEDLILQIETAKGNAKTHSGDIPGPLREGMIEDQGGQSNGELEPGHPTGVGLPK